MQRSLPKFTGEGEDGRFVVTNGRIQYQYFPVANGVVQFRVKTAHDAGIALTTDQQEAGPMYEVWLGIFKNKRSQIVKNRTMPNVAETKTDGILSKTAYRGFWVSFENGNICAGHDGDQDSFITWSDPEPIRITFVGICTSEGSPGYWEIGDITTLRYPAPESPEYLFFPAYNGKVEFKVRASNDAKIALATEPKESDSMYEIIIGGSGNTISSIKKVKNNVGPTVQTPQILSKENFHSFWIKWDTKGFTVGRGGETQPFIPRWEDVAPIPILYFGICTGMGADGSWKIDAPPAYHLSAPVSAATWVNASEGKVPRNAVQGGQDTTGEPTYVARIIKGDDVIPGKLIPSTGSTYVTKDSTEYSSDEYQVLVHRPYDNWVSTFGSNIPANALIGGQTTDGEDLYVGRVRIDGIYINGWVQKSDGYCYISKNGREMPFSHYEILLS